MLCAGAWWLQSNKLKDLETRIAADEKRQRDLQAIKLQVDQFQQRKAILENKVLVIEQLRLAQKSPVHMLDEISKALPDFVWLTGMDETKGSLRFQGQSNSLAAVADFISGLQRSGWFPQVDLGSSQEDQNIVNFTVTGTFKDPEVAAKEKAAAEAKAAAAPRGRRPPGKELGRRRWRRIPLTKLPLAAQLGVSAVIAALICGGFYYFWYSDALETQKTQEAKLADLQTQIRALEATANKLPEFQREVQALEARLETLKRILPAGEGDARPHAARSVPRRAVEPPDPQVQPGRPGPEGLLPGGPGQPRPRGDLPQPGSLPRPRQPDVASRQRGRRQDQGPGEAHDQRHDPGLGGGHHVRLPGHPGPAAAAQKGKRPTPGGAR